MSCIGLWNSKFVLWISPGGRDRKSADFQCLERTRAGDGLLAAVHKKLDCIVELLVALHFIAFARIQSISVVLFFFLFLSKRRRADFLEFGQI